MLIWMCALHCEAKPIIDHYRLKKNADVSAFDLYQLEDIACIVSGIGELNMAAACAWAASRFQQTTPCWINLGIAGHQSLDIGSLLMAAQVSQQQSKQSIYPVPILKHSIPVAHIISQTSERLDYHEQAAYDMEAYAFLHSCSRFSPLELCTCIKVISDNADHKPQRDKAQISQLIAHQIQAVTDYAQGLQQLAKDYNQQILPAASLARFTQLAHFTRSQHVQLWKILLGLRAFDESLDSAYRLAQPLGNSKTIITELQQQLTQQCERF